MFLALEAYHREGHFSISGEYVKFIEYKLSSLHLKENAGQQQTREEKKIANLHNTANFSIRAPLTCVHHRRNLIQNLNNCPETTVVPPPILRNALENPHSSPLTAIVKQSSFLFPGPAGYQLAEPPATNDNAGSSTDRPRPSTTALHLPELSKRRIHG